MKRILLFSVIFVFSLTYLLQGQQNTFSKVLYDSDADDISIHSLVSDFENGYIAAGGVFSDEGLIMKIDNDGNVLWNKIYDNNTSKHYPALEFQSIASTKDSCFIIVGNAYNESKGSVDAFCMKIHSNGDIVWSTTITHINYIYLQSVYPTKDSGCIVTGYENIWEVSNKNIFVSKLNLNGEIEWSKIITSNDNCTAKSVKQISDSSYVLTGSIREKQSPYNSFPFLLSLSRAGEVIWAKKYRMFNNENFSAGNDFLVVNNGYLYHMRTRNSIIIVKTDFRGNIIWNKSYEIWGDNTIGEPGPILHATSDNAYIFVDGNIFAGMVLKIDSAGAPLWSKDVSFYATDVIETDTKEYLICGNGPLIGAKKNLNSLSGQIGLIQIDSMGNDQNCCGSSTISLRIDSLLAESVSFSSSSNVGSMSSIPINIRSDEILNRVGCVDYVGINAPEIGTEIKIYPNPTNGVFTVSLHEPLIGYFIVYNCLGQEVVRKELINDRQLIDISKQSRGIYYYKLISSNNISLTGKIVLTK